MVAAHYCGALLVLALIFGIGLYSGTLVKSARDFVTGSGKAGPSIVAGVVIGTLVGGSATIGTAQLAFVHGFSAWWLTLGGGLGCLVLVIFYSRPLHESGVSTMPQILAREYGGAVAVTALLLTSLGSMLAVIPQVLSGVALITSVSELPVLAAVVLSVTLMLAYVSLGGVWGSGLAGIAKTLLLLCLMGLAGLLALHWQGGWSSFRAILPAERYFTLVSRGVAVDIGAGMSLIMGMVTTQIYLQAAFSARSLRASRAGLLVSAVIIPLIGLGGIMVGLYMRVHRPDIPSFGALPIFILDYIPPLLGGMMFGTLFITLMGTAGGVALGISSMICADIYRARINPHADDKAMLRVSRGVLLAIFVLAALVGANASGTMIMNWSFLSMGLRASVAFGVLSAAIFMPGRISASYALAAMCAGLVCAGLGKVFAGHLMDPLFPGVAASLLVLLAGYLRPR